MEITSQDRFFMDLVRKSVEVIHKTEIYKVLDGIRGHSSEELSMEHRKMGEAIPV